MHDLSKPRRFNWSLGLPVITLTISTARSKSEERLLHWNSTDRKFDDGHSHRSRPKVQGPMPSVQYPTSSIQYPRPNTQYPTPTTQHPKPSEQSQVQSSNHLPDENAGQGFRWIHGIWPLNSFLAA
ncbi:hypothetical protein H4I96_04960 [Botrytis cinerea]